MSEITNWEGCDDGECGGKNYLCIDFADGKHYEILLPKELTEDEWSCIVDMQEDCASQQSRITELEQLISQWADNPITKNEFALKGAIEKKE